MLKDEIWGSDDHRSILRRGEALARAVGGDPAYIYYGRSLGLASPADAGPERLMALVEALGASHYGAIEACDLEAVRESVEAHGFSATEYLRWEGGAEALDAARAIVADASVADDLTLVTLDDETDGAVLSSMAEMALAAGVLPLPGMVLRGLRIPALSVVAVDRAGRVVSVAAASVAYHPAHPTRGGRDVLGHACHPSRQAGGAVGAGPWRPCADRDG